MNDCIVKIVSKSKWGKKLSDFVVMLKLDLEFIDTMVLRFMKNNSE